MSDFLSGIAEEKTCQIIGSRYRIVRKIGEGGKGSVYLVLNIQTEQFWAAKRIPDASAAHELEMMKNLKNSHLPQLIDVLEDGGTVWLVMEYVRGVRLDHYLRDGRTLSEEQVVEVMTQVCEALCYLQGHSPPVCHLDIKPQNLIRTKDGQLKLVDFGAAWKIDTLQVQEGTDGYAAPEQYDKDAAKDGRTDIYGLGAAAYRLASGKKYSDSFASGQVPGCGKRVSEIIRKCLEKKPENRFQTAGELKRELLRVQRQEKRERGRRQLLAVFAFALPAAAFFSQVIPGSLKLFRQEEWTYEKLLSEARCVSEKESREYYRAAALLNPNEARAYLNYLEDAGADGSFSEEEEAFLRDLLHLVPIDSEQTQEEILQQNSGEYGLLADRIGILYRYEYSGADGKRIASGWFRKAFRAGEKMKESHTRLAVTEIPGTETCGTKISGKEEGHADGTETAGTEGSSDPDSPWLKEAEFYLKLASLDESTDEAAETDESSMRRDAAEYDEGGDTRTDTDSEKAARKQSDAVSYWNLLEEGRDYLYAGGDPFLIIRKLTDAAWQLTFRIPDLLDCGFSDQEIREKMSYMQSEVRVLAEMSGLPDTGTAAAALISDIEEAVSTAEERIENWRNRRRDTA